MRLPACTTLPIVTDWTLSGAILARRTTSPTTTAPSSVAAVPFRVPLKAPIAVRTGSAMMISCFDILTALLLSDMTTTSLLFDDERNYCIGDDRNYICQV
jgi:hypothetical protein